METKVTTPDSIIQFIRDSSATNKEIGDRFEKFTKKFLETDPVWKPQFSNIFHYSEWALENDRPANDIGIDLVGEFTDGSGCAAIQCKCYQSDHRIDVRDVDRFIVAAKESPFTTLIFVDTTEGKWGINAENAVLNQTNFKRIRLDDFRKSMIDWEEFAGNFETEKVVKLKSHKEIRDYQETAIQKVINGFKTADRGKLIMACGTGKTFTTLKIAERIAGGDVGGRVLVLVPSLALMSQTIREWFSDTTEIIRAAAVCSDSQVAKQVKAKSKEIDDIDADTDIDVIDLAIPVSTDPTKLFEKISNDVSDCMTVVFSTYQSIDTISEAQSKGMPKFDLIICDEAHRTTGVKIEGAGDQKFVKIHDNEFIKGDKRLYMTATPRIFSKEAKKKAGDMNAILCSMDNTEQFGEVFYTLNFGDAVSNGLLTDYKVIVLAMDQQIVSRSVQKRFEVNEELDLDNATKIIGCFKALRKKTSEFISDKLPMQRVIMFCNTIKQSKIISKEFEEVVTEYVESDFADWEDWDSTLKFDVEHVDGTMNSKKRDQLLNWLDEKKENASECRILSNAKCLSEGVDVPDLDAIMFMYPRKSQVDIVQAVGRVMRTAPDKKMGYIILPVVIPPDVSPEEALNDNKKYEVVWSVLNALRSHDDSFDAIINTPDLNGNFGGRIEIIAEVADITKKSKRSSVPDIGSDAIKEKSTISTQGELDLDYFYRAMSAKIVKKCGNRLYWKEWAKNVGDIAQKCIERIKGSLEMNENNQEVFNNFLSEIRSELNENITKEEAIEMLGQHYVTKPVFESLFDDYEFIKMNPVSSSMQKLVEILEPANIQSESGILEDFYRDVKRYVSGINSLEGKQHIIKTLYEKFFKDAFPKLSKKLGIVYTPIEVTDFMIHSVNDILIREFGHTLGDRGVNILDPFTGCKKMYPPVGSRLRA